jgi:disulfide bond formation protein DsbB
MSPQIARSLNVVFVIAVTLILLAAFGVQFLKGELPCPLCLLQRLAMLGVGAGAVLNVRYGVRPRHYGLALASAIFGGAVAGRQVLLHIAPGDPGYGEPLFGLHLYSWSFVAFVLIGVILSVMLWLEGQFETATPPKISAPAFPRLSAAVLLLFCGVAIANVFTTLLLCGLGPCRDEPTHYEWLWGASAHAQSMR